MADLLPAPLLDVASRADLEACLVWLTGRESVLPPPRRDYPSVVMAAGPRAAFSDDDLRLLARFARHVTAAFDADGPGRDGANFHVVEARDGRFLHGRLHWEVPPRPFPDMAALVARAGEEGYLPEVDEPTGAAAKAFDVERGFAPPPGIPGP